ncbi:MAG TPA: ATP-binding cassette domain-containing protein [Turneriella sp.]|nr:ATP-binding cassette domain-containing protein [Turneriella sp.]
MAEEVLRFENVWYGGDYARDHVDNVSFSLNRGEGMLISGPEGSGKSLILDLVMAKRLPKHGKIWHDGVILDLKKETEVGNLRFSIGYVTQTAGLINNLSVLENIILPLRYHTEMKDDELFAAADIWIDRYELGHRKNARPVALSASEMMRTAIIRALIVEPRILLLDSIVDALCPLASRRMLELLFEDIRLRNITYILSSYHPTIFDGRDLKFMLLYRGEVVFQGNLADIKRADNVFLEQYRAYRTQGPMPPFNATL